MQRKLSKIFYFSEHGTLKKMFDRRSQFKKWYIDTDLNANVTAMKEKYAKLLKFKRSIQKTDLAEVKSLAKEIADHGKELHRQLAVKYIPVRNPRKICDRIDYSH